MKDVTGGRGGPSAQNQGSLQGEDPLAHDLAQLALTLEAESEVEALLAEIVRAAVEMVPGADEGSLSLVSGRRTVTSHMPTGALPTLIDALQSETGQGPCLDATYDHETVRVDDLTSEPRWPLFTARASALGARSMLSFQLFVSGEDLGALNLISQHVNAFDDESEHIGLLFASHAAIAVVGAREERDLRTGMVTRTVIGQATGVLMERLKITPEQAFTLLIRASQHHNVKLRDVADRLVLTGHLAHAPSLAGAEARTVSELQRSREN